MNELTLEYIKEICEPVAKKLFDEMKSNRKKVSEINKKEVSDEPVLYRWWFPKDSLIIELIQKLCCKNKKYGDILDKIETIKYNNTTYYALYLGKSVNGRRRFSQHTTGNIKTSTIRHTLYGLLFTGKDKDNTHYKDKEENITVLLKDCLYEWYAFKDKKELVKCIESMCLVSGKYPLNIDGNTSINNDWREYLLQCRKLKK
jgi:predicted GIY-YIG superfamily endonuclease